MLLTQDQLFTNYARIIERASPYCDDALAAAQLLRDTPGAADDALVALIISRLELVLDRIERDAPAFAIPPARRNSRRRH